jgi:hypothetical protein
MKLAFAARRATHDGPRSSLAGSGSHPRARHFSRLRAGASSRTQDRVARWRRLLRVDLVDVQPSSRGPPTALGGQISPGPPGHQQKGRATLTCATKTRSRTRRASTTRSRPTPQL